MVNITDSQWHIMEILWETPEPMTVNQISEKLELERGICWNKNTVNTFLVRLAEHEAVAYTQTVPKAFYALLGRDICVREEQKSFLDKMYQGSLKMMIASFIKDNNISREEILEIQQLLEEETHE